MISKRDDDFDSDSSVEEDLLEETKHDEEDAVNQSPLRAKLESLRLDNFKGACSQQTIEDGESTGCCTRTAF